MTHLRFLLRGLLLAACLLVLGTAQAQLSARQTEDGPDTQLQTGGAAIGTGTTGISQATSIARPADSLTTLNRDIGKVGGDSTTTSTQGADELNRVLSRARGLARNEPPSQFQKFVQEATGKLLPHFGSQLFDAPQNYVPDAGLAAPASYLLGPGDEIRLQVWGAVDFSATLALDRNGQVLIPKVGVVALAGVRVADLEPVLKGQLSKVYTNFSLNATLGKLRSIQVYVVGQSRQPGTYAVSSLSTLVNVLFVSGGPSANGSMRGIELQRAGKAVTKLDLYDFIAKGDKSRDVALQPGDVIFIPPAGPRVAVAGAFDQAAIYELKDAASSVADVLGLGGGASPMASARKALLERVNPEKIPARQVLDLALDAPGLAQNLRGGDILTLLPVSPAFVNAVTLQGVVADPLRYRWFEGMKILDLIPDREALITPDYHKRKNLLVQNEQANKDAKDPGTPGESASKEAGAKIAERFRRMVDQINWDYAVIERLNRDKLSTDLIPFNLGRAVIQKDASHNLALLPGDVVTILSQSDLALPQERQTRLVRVEGEVGAPGIYQANPGETMPQLIKRVGGLTPQAYLFGTEFNRESVRVRQQENLDTLIRKLEAQLQARAGAATGNAGMDASTAQALQVQQQAQLKAQINRLKTLKSNGRLALELDPQAQALSHLPTLPLEDGDRILIPSTPGYVAALGSVNNENALIYKAGKTVGDVIRTAGLTEDAEPDSAFVLRADGSVISRRDHSGLFGGFESIAVMPGDTLVVPAQVDRETRYNFVTRALKDWTQIFYNFGLGVAALKTIKSL
jgi:protein involved in polysaccharide export with SLBB domain